MALCVPEPVAAVRSRLPGPGAGRTVGQLEGGRHGPSTRADGDVRGGVRRHAHRARADDDAPGEGSHGDARRPMTIVEP